MRLLIISHTPHYRHDGRIVGWGATTREIDELATLFESIVHLAPLYPDVAPASAMPYRSPRVRLRPLAPAGGERLGEKLQIPLRYPAYARAILQECRSADVVHVRAPANISLLALVLLAILRRPKVRWAKYAGDWSGGKSEPATYRFQRWWLAKGFHRGVVTVNGRWPNQVPHIHSFLNPCLTETELEQGCEASRSKRLVQPLRLLFVGRIESAKGVDICLELMAQLGKANISAHLDVVGEGEEISKFQQQARSLNVFPRVTFHGGLPRDMLSEYYGRAHFILLPSESEGWPKVLSEAMAFGAVPIATAVGSIPEYLRGFSTGQAISLRDPSLLRAAIQDYLNAPSVWAQHSMNAVKAARQFSYGNYLQAVRDLLKLPAEPK